MKISKFKLVNEKNLSFLFLIFEHYRTFGINFLIFLASHR